MQRADTLSASHNVSYTPLRTLSSFTFNERQVIWQRRRGWERCEIGALARIFQTDERTIKEIVRDGDKRFVL